MTILRNLRNLVMARLVRATYDLRAGMTGIDGAAALWSSSPRSWVARTGRAMTIKKENNHVASLKEACA